jgi:hypothetical protein
LLIKFVALPPILKPFIDETRGHSCHPHELTALYNTEEQKYVFIIELAVVVALIKD